VGTPIATDRQGGNFGDTDTRMGRTRRMSRGKFQTGGLTVEMKAFPKKLSKISDEATIGKGVES